MAKNPDTVLILDQASGYLQIDMLEAYGSKYDERAIVAATIVERGTPLSKEVQWHKTIKYDRSSAFRRVYTWLIATMQMFWIVAWRYRKAHIVAITNPPFSIYVPWILGVKSYDIVIYDAYPDALVNFGYTEKNSLFYRVWSRLNEKAFEGANRIFTLTNGMKELVCSYVDNAAKVEVVNLWSDANDFKPVVDDHNEILIKTNSHGKFCLVYSGNLGLTHPVEKLVELAALLDPARFSIIIIGGGAKDKLLKEIQAKKQYLHVHLLPWQPIELLSHSLHAADLSVVTLDKEASNLSIPSKTFNILSVGNPVLGICESDSGLAEVIQKHNCGIISDGHDLKQLARQIIELEADQDLQKKLKANSLKASKSFTKANALKYL